MQKKSIKSIKIEQIFFVLSVVFSIVVTYFVTKRCIDADASSELVLAQHLAKTGQILSTDWIYSTELRVFNTQLIYAPLFLLFNNWHLIRFFGSVIMQGILVLCFYLFTRMININRKVFYLSSALFLLPISVCWGRIVLYHCYYIPHIAISLLVVGLTFASGRYKLRLLLLSLISFVGGLGGIRQLMMTHVPILLCVCIYGFIDDFSKSNQTAFIKENLRLVLSVIASCGFSAVGFLANKFYLMKIYTFADYSENTINLLDADQFKKVIYGFFHHFGLRDEVELLSVVGVLSALGILLGIYCILVSVAEIRKYKNQQDIKKALPYVFFISYILVMALVFLLIGNNYYFVLYLTPLTIWMVTIVASQFYNSPKKLSILNLRRAISLIAVALVLANGLVNSVYLNSNSYFGQRYEGLRFQAKNHKEIMTPVVDFLQQEGYQLGYATFWNSNIITEMTNGEIKTINIELHPTSGNVRFYDWLTLKSNRSLQNQKDFLLLERTLQSDFESGNDLSGCVIVYTDDQFIVYDVTDFLS